MQLQPPDKEKRNCWVSALLLSGVRTVRTKTWQRLSSSACQTLLLIVCLSVWRRIWFLIASSDWWFWWVGVNTEDSLFVIRCLLLLFPIQNSVINIFHKLLRKKNENRQTKDTAPMSFSAVSERSNEKVAGSSYQEHKCQVGCQLLLNKEISFCGWKEKNPAVQAALILINQHEATLQWTVIMLTQSLQEKDCTRCG